MCVAILMPEIVKKRRRAFSIHRRAKNKGGADPKRRACAEPDADDGDPVKGGLRIGHLDE